MPSKPDVEIDAFLKWLDDQKKIAADEDRQGDRKALEKIDESIVSFIRSPSEGNSATWAASDHPEGPKGPLLDTIRSFKKMYENTLAFNNACNEIPLKPPEEVLPLLKRANDSANDALETASHMEDSDSVSAAVVGAAGGAIGGAIYGAAKYAFKYGLEFGQESGGFTISGIVSAAIGIAVGLIGGAIYGAVTVAAKGWEAGNAWEANRNVEEKDTQIAFDEAIKSLSTSRDTAKGTYQDAKAGSRPDMAPLPEKQHEQGEDEDEEEEESKLGLN